MLPETESVELSPDDARVADQPCRCAECDAHAHKRHQEYTDADVAGQTSLLHAATLHEFLSLRLRVCRLIKRSHCLPEYTQPEIYSS